MGSSGRGGPVAGPGAAYGVFLCLVPGAGRARGSDRTFQPSVGRIAHERLPAARYRGAAVDGGTT